MLSPAKRGRKPGSGKKNIIKAASGKVVFVTVDLSKFAPGTILLQVTSWSMGMYILVNAHLPFIPIDLIIPLLYFTRFILPRA